MVLKVLLYSSVSWSSFSDCVAVECSNLNSSKSTKSLAGREVAGGGHPAVWHGVHGGIRLTWLVFVVALQCHGDGVGGLPDTEGAARWLVCLRAL